MKSVLCLGLTPVLQRTLRFDTLTLNEVNRARQAIVSAAGKAVNTAHALVTLGTPASVTGLNGGASGVQVADALRRWGVEDGLTAMRAPTRTCTTLLDSAGATVTELVEEAPDPGVTALRRFNTGALRRIASSSCVVISGTLPPFAPDDSYVRFARAARAAAVPLVIDSHRGALLNVLVERPWLVKLNRHELATTLGGRITTPRHMQRGMRDLLNRGARNVCVTQGSDATWLANAQGFWLLQPPPIRACVNPIGSGDCATAGMVHRLLQGASLPAAARFGVACGSANVEQETPAAFTPARARTLARYVRVTRF